MTRQSRCPVAPLLPSLSGPSRRRSTVAWATSTSVAALLVSGLAALAMSVQPSGESMGETAAPMLVMLPPAPAVEAMTEPAPEAAEAVEEQAEAPEAEEAPDTPELTEAPETPDAVEMPEEILAEDMPELDIDPPPVPVAEAVIPDIRPKARPERAPEKPPEKPPEPVKEKPKKKAEAPKEKPKEKKKASAAAAAASGAAPSKPAEGAKSTGKGKASAASYGAEVMKKIRRTKQKKAPGRGSAIVSFVIADSGALASVQIGRSSGNAALDQIALDHIRRSAPFPAPPAGAGRRFSFEFVGR